MNVIQQVHAAARNIGFGWQWLVSVGLKQIQVTLQLEGAAAKPLYISAGQNRTTV